MENACVKKDLISVDHLIKQVHSKPCQTFNMEHFAKKFIERTILDV